MGAQEWSLMIEEVLQSVKQTEEQAAALVAEAEQSAQVVKAAVDSDIASQWEQTRARAKAHRMERLEQARVEADNRAQQIRSQSEGECRALVDRCATQIDAIVDELTERITHGDC